MKPIIFLLIAMLAVPCFADGISFVNEQSDQSARATAIQTIENIQTPVPDGAPDGGMLSSDADELRQLAKEIKADGEKIKRLADETRSMAERLLEAQTKGEGLKGPGFAPGPQNDSDLEARVAKLEGRMDSVEEQLRALVTVKHANGTTTTAEVEIDHVRGYGEFAVPKGGRVVAINGVTLQRGTTTTTSTSSTYAQPVYQTPEYQTEIVNPQSRTVRFTPRGGLFRGFQSNSTCANGNCR